MNTISAQKVASIFESIAPRDTGIAGDDLGFVYGDSDQDVRGVACMWMADIGAIGRAVEQGADMLVVHEHLFEPHEVSPWYDGPKRPEDVLNNRLRRELLERHGIVVYRSHSNWDALPVDGVVDQAVAALGIDGLRCVASQKFFKVHELPAAMSLSELARIAGRGIGGVVRTFGADRPIRRFSMLVGGFGGNQLHIPQTAVEMGAEAIIIGEMTESIVVSALECGACVIATLHSLSEIPAIRRQAQLLAEKLPIPVRYVHSGAMGF